MRVFVILGIFQGIPSETYCFLDREAARRRAHELAEEYGILARPWDWDAEDGRWNPQQGSHREWEHHWYDEESDIIVAECGVEGVVGKKREAA